MNTKIGVEDLGLITDLFVSVLAGLAISEGGAKIAYLLQGQGFLPSLRTSTEEWVLLLIFFTYVFRWTFGGFLHLKTVEDAPKFWVCDFFIIIFQFLLIAVMGFLIFDTNLFLWAVLLLCILDVGWVGTFRLPFWLRPQEKALNIWAALNVITILLLFLFFGNKPISLTYLCIFGLTCLIFAVIDLYWTIKYSWLFLEKSS